MTGGPVASLALLVWIPVTFFLFSRLEPLAALLISILGGYLILPPLVAFDIPMLPALDKYSIPALAAYLAALAIRGDRAPLSAAGFWGTCCVALVVVGAIGTALTNGDPRFIGAGVVLPGLALKDAASMTINLMPPLLVWALAIRYVRTSRDLRRVLAFLVAAMLVYALPMLVEIRLSPQLNMWVYGFFQHRFDQMIRFGGFRPIVFLEHGIWVALLTVMAAMAAALMVRISPPADRSRHLLSLLFLLVMVALCRTMAAWAYALVFVPLLLLAGPRLLARMALVLGLAVFAYPLLRLYGLVPIDWLVESFGRLSADRAQSLGYRFDNEWILLEHAQARPLFGWGEWNRNHVFDADARHLSVADGEWIVVLGTRGIVGFVAQFGLLLLAVVRACVHAPRSDLPVVLSGAAMILAINMADLLPNATLTPLTWLLAGALTGVTVKRTQVTERKEALSQELRFGHSPAFPESRTLI